MKNYALVVRGLDRKVNVKGLRKNKLYEIDFTKVHEANVVKFAQALKKYGAHKLRHLNVKSGHALLCMVSGMNLNKILCQFLKHSLRINNIGHHFLMMEANKQLSL